MAAAIPVYRVKQYNQNYVGAFQHIQIQISYLHLSSVTPQKMGVRKMRSNAEVSWTSLTFIDFHSPDLRYAGLNIFRD